MCVISFHGQAACSPHPLDLILSCFVPSRLFVWQMQALHTCWMEHPWCSGKQHARQAEISYSTPVCARVRNVMDRSYSPNCCLYCRCLVVYNWKSEGKRLVSFSSRILVLSIGWVMQAGSKNDLIRELCIAYAVFCSARGKEWKSDWGKEGPRRPCLLSEASHCRASYLIWLCDTKRIKHDTAGCYRKIIVDGHMLPPWSWFICQ